MLPVEDCRTLLGAVKPEANASLVEAVTLAEMLIGSYPRSDFIDPKVFISALAANFADFPASIGRQAIDPVKGLPATLKWAPKIADVRSFLDDALARRRTIAYRAEWMLKEHKRRQEEAEREARIAKERINVAQRVGQIFAKHGAAI